MLRIFALLMVVAVSAGAQTAATPSVQASGSSTIQGIQPDQVQLTVGVVTFAASAQVAASQNATQTNAVIAALHNVVGAAGTIQTIGYSLAPQYSGSTGNVPPSITGYTATNSLQVTTGSLNLAGPLIDAANQAGANSISGPSYSLQNSDPYTEQALTAASKQALAYAAAIAAGLGGENGSGDFRHPGLQRHAGGGAGSRRRRGHSDSERNRECIGQRDSYGGASASIERWRKRKPSLWGAAASGVWKRSIAKWTACFRRYRVTWAGRWPTRVTKTSARAGPGTWKWYR